MPPSDCKDKILRVSRQPSGEPEIFHSLQGEGVTAGRPSVFLRLATCNLACSWCDTKYTWDWDSYDYERKVVSLSVSEVEERVMEFRCPRLVITGGEPADAAGSAGAAGVVPMKRQGFYCEVETNGTLAPSAEMVDSVSQWNVSPKLNSGNRTERREVAGPLAAFRDLSNAYFKFVVVDRPDVDEVSALVDRYGIPAGQVVLMPEGTTADALARPRGWPKPVPNADTASARGCTSLLWSDERGR